MRTRVDLGEGARDAVPDPLEGREVAPDAARVAPLRVDCELASPEREPPAIHLGRRPVAQLEVEPGLGDPDRGELRRHGSRRLTARSSTSSARLMRPAILGGTSPELNRRQAAAAQWTSPEAARQSTSMSSSAALSWAV